MDNNVLQILFKVKDEASDALKGIGGQVKKVSDTLNDSFKVASVASGIALAGLTAEAVRSIGAFNDSQKVLNQLDAVLKSTKGSAGVTKDQVLDLASAMQKLTTYSDETVVEAENMLLTFTSIGKKVFPDAIKTVLDMSTALGQDLKSSSIQLGKALNDPIQGVTALRRVGVSFNESQLEQIATMQKSGDIMGAQKLILAELAKEFGGSAVNATKSFGGQMEQMKNAVNDLEEVFGGFLVGAITPYITKLATVARATLDVIQGTKSLSDLTKILDENYGALGLHLGQIIEYFAQSRNSTIALAGAFTGFLNIGTLSAIKNMVLLASKMMPAIAIASTLGAVIFLAATHFNEFKDAIGASSDQMGGRFNKALASVMMMIFKVQDVLAPIVEFLKGAFAQAWAYLQGAFQEFGSAVQSQLMPALGELWVALQPLMPYLKQLAEALGVAIVGAIMIAISVVTALARAFAVVIPFIVQAVTGLVQIITGVVNVIVGLFSGDLVTAVQGVVQIFVGAFNLIMGTLTAVLGFIYTFIESVIMFFMNLYNALIGQSIIPDIVNGIINWFLNLINTVVGMVSGFINTIINAFLMFQAVVGSIFSNIQAVIINAVTAISAYFLSGLNGMLNGARSIMNNIVGAFRNMVDSVMSVLRQIKFPHVSVGSGSATVAGKKIEFPTLNVDWYEKGGFVKNTGLAVVHEGEYVLSKDMLRGNTPVDSGVGNMGGVNITYIANEKADMDVFGYKLVWLMQNSR